VPEPFLALAISASGSSVGRHQRAQLDTEGSLQAVPELLRVVGRDLVAVVEPAPVLFLLAESGQRAVIESIDANDRPFRGVVK
jgi:hypothetical protein